MENDCLAVTDGLPDAGARTGVSPGCRALIYLYRHKWPFRQIFLPSVRVRHAFSGNRPGRLSPMVLFRKVFGATGILPVRRTGWKPVLPKAAGTEARPTKSFHNLRVGLRLIRNCLEELLRNWWHIAALRPQPNPKIAGVFLLL